MDSDGSDIESSGDSELSESFCEVEVDSGLKYVRCHTNYILRMIVIVIL